MATIPPLTTGYTLEEAEQDIADLRGDVDGMNEVLSLLDGPIPNITSVSGCQLYSTNGQPGYVNFTALTMSLMGAQPANFPAVTNNTTTPTALASFQIPAGDPDIGAIYDLEAWGNGTQGTTAQVLNMSVVLAGHTMASIQLGAGFMNTSIIFRWRATARVICHTIGLTGTWSSLIYGNVSLFNGTLLSSGASSNNPTNSFVSSESSGTTTVDTTSSATIALDAWWTSAAGTTAPTITSQVSFAKRLC